MATSYPGALDTNTELGGPFTNVSAVTDPLTQIDAADRNSLNDAMFAVQARIGITNSAVDTSLTWATLCTSGNYNQGLRFKSTAAQWPGEVGESGIFVESTTQFVYYHRAGEAKSTFYALSTGSVTLDTGYNNFGGAGTVDVDAGDLTWTVPDAAVFYDIIWDDGTDVFMQISGSTHTLVLGSTGGANEKYVQIDGVVKSDIIHTPANPSGDFTSHTSNITSGGADGAVATAGALSFSANLVGAAGDTNNFVMTGYKASYTDGGGSNLPVGFWANTGFAYGLFAQSPLRFFGNTTTGAFTLQQEGTGSLLELNQGGDDKFIVENDGSISHSIATSDLDDPLTAYSQSFTIGGLAPTETVRGVAVAINEGTVATGGIVYGADFQYTAAAGTIDTYYAMNVDADWQRGLYSQSPIGLNISGTTVFVDFDGNAAAGAAGNISTDEAGTADMLRVEVGGNARWIAAYNATTLPAVAPPSWDDVYDNDPDSTLTIDVADKPFYVEQVAPSSTGSAVSIYRTERPTTDNYDDAALLVYTNHDVPGTTGAPSFWVRHVGRSEDVEDFSSIIEIGDSVFTSGLLIRRFAGASNEDRYLIKTEAPSAAARFWTRQNGSTYVNTGTNTDNGSGDEPALALTMNANATAFRVDQAATGDIVQFRDGTTDRWVLSEGGLAVHSVVDSGTVAFDAYSVSVTTGALAGDDILAYGIHVSMDGSSIVDADCGVVGFTSTPTSLGSGIGIGFYAESGWSFGMYSNSGLLSIADTGQTFAVTSFQNTASNNTHGSIHAAVTCTDEDHTGNTFYGIYLECDGKSDTTSSGMFNGIYLKYNQSGAAAADATYALLVDNDGTGWDWGVYSNVKSRIEQADGVGAAPVLELSQLDTDESFVNFSGTSGAGSSVSISTSVGTPGANAPDAAVWTLTEMIQVEINGSTRWIPAYTAV